MREVVSRFAALCACCFCLIACAAAEVLPLPITREAWEQKIFPPEGVAREEAALFDIENDPAKGPSLSVSRWRAGLWSARYQYSQPLPMLRGTLRGWYRTEDIGEPAAAVYVQFFKGEKHLHTESHRLEPAGDWAQFTFVFRRPPLGTDAAYVGVGLQRKTEGKVLFADLVVSPELPPLVFPEDPGEPTRPAPAADFAKGKFFRLAKRGGVWWLVTPEGTGFYSVGTDGPWFRRREQFLNEGKRYAAWLHENGFNSLGGWTDIWRWSTINDALWHEGKTPLATFVALETGTRWGDFDHLLDAEGKPQDERHAFPDPFDPRFEEAYRGEVRTIAQLVKNRPWFVGWFADNEVSHRDLHRYVYSAHCSKALRGFLEQRYEDIDALNRAWGTSYPSFEDLLRRRPDPAGGPRAMEKDYRLFSQQIVKRYIDTTFTIIREEDPGRLVFSNRFMFGDFGYLGLYARYDGIAINLYPDNNDPGLSEQEVATLRRAHAETGRPVIIGEWSVPAADSGLYDDPEKLDWSWPQVVETQTDRARQAACVALDFYNLPFLVGAHWFTWRDFDSKERRANRGLWRADGTPYVELAAALRRAHEKMGPALRWPVRPPE